MDKLWFLASCVLLTVHSWALDACDHIIWITEHTRRGLNWAIHLFVAPIATLHALVVGNTTRVWQVPMITVLAERPVLIIGNFPSHSLWAKAELMSHAGADLALFHRDLAWKRQVHASAVIAEIRHRTAWRRRWLIDGSIVVMQLVRR